MNYRIHTDAIQTHLIPPQLSAKQTSLIYVSEADVTQLVCLSNLENLNALFIADGLSQKDRLERLNRIAIHQMTLLADNGNKQERPAQITQTIKFEAACE